ncbi:MAG: hypothetical protein A2V67_12765 [Deltaproteobacteria bacterium RBG_13_61_14]|nr:MAG: hypothetical protein A2V67_12765 [Deltaproteobacteria bacterium RBG_13_61_14]
MQNLDFREQGGINQVSGGDAVPGEEAASRDLGVSESDEAEDEPLPSEPAADDGQVAGQAIRGQSFTWKITELSFM